MNGRPVSPRSLDQRVGVAGGVDCRRTRTARRPADAGVGAARARAATAPCSRPLTRGGRTGGCRCRRWRRRHWAHCSGSSRRRSEGEGEDLVAVVVGRTGTSTSSIGMPMRRARRVRRRSAGPRPYLAGQLDVADARTGSNSTAPGVGRRLRRGSPGPSRSTACRARASRCSATSVDVQRGQEPWRGEGDGAALAAAAADQLRRRRSAR